ncbi:MAG: hypothetical protein H6509_15070 [Bryobacterales bacterium]|nr:hypothetical protein [Acidobacteriota bacterium]MCB9385930.1 hypothetical protein [Bryobacterales bacterium]
MRRSIHFGLCALLAIVSISAPFAHTHDKTVSAEHLARVQYRVLHAHIPMPSKDAAVQQVDDSARRVNWYHFEHEKSIALAAPPARISQHVERPQAVGWIESADVDRAPEESPPRAVIPRGPPSLSA